MVGVGLFMSVLDLEKVGGGAYGWELLQIRPGSGVWGLVTTFVSIGLSIWERDRGSVSAGLGVWEQDWNGIGVQCCLYGSRIEISISDGFRLDVGIGVGVKLS